MIVLWSPGSTKKGCSVQAFVVVTDHDLITVPTTWLRKFLMMKTVFPGKLSAPLYPDNPNITLYAERYFGEVQVHALKEVEAIRLVEPTGQL